MTTALDSFFFRIFLILNLNQSQFFAKHSNQSLRFILYGHHVNAIFVSVKVAKFEIKRHIFPYILIFYHIKQIDSMMPCVCSEIDHRWSLPPKEWHTRRSRVCHWCSYHILTSSVIYYWTDARQHGIYLLIRQNKNNEGKKINEQIFNSVSKRTSHQAKNNQVNKRWSKTQTVQINL